MNITPFSGLELWRKVMFEFVRQGEDASDLSARQTAVLLHIYLSQPPHTIKGLASQLNIAKPAITRAVDKLSALGFVKRQTDEKDRRIIKVERTIQGAAFVTAMGDIISEQAKATVNMDE